jgi:D-beta-D-heptose 7-phosphate kinase/D-beta-D-heptose 1-phosphate adenosyltransferase
LKEGFVEAFMFRDNHKIFSPKALLKEICTQRKKHRSIVFTNGCFDLLHIGHVRLLKKAKALGDVLIVALNSDSSVRKLKGVERPIFPLKDRMEILSSFEAVDYVTYFKENTPEAILKLLAPNVLVKGGDYKISQIIGADYIKNKGGRVIVLPFVKGKSSSNILKKIKRIS